VITAALLGFAAIATSFWIFPLLIMYLFIVSIFFDDDWYFLGFFFLAIPLVLIYFSLREAGSFEMPSWQTLIMSFGGYFVFGTAWSLYKWRVFVKDLRKAVESIVSTVKPTVWREVEKLVTLRNGETRKETDRSRVNVAWPELKTEEKGEYLSEVLSSKFTEFLDKEKLKSELRLTPSIDHWKTKGKVFTWILYWPFSLVNYVFGRLIKDLIDSIIEQLKGVYNAIAAQVMKGLEV